MNARNQLIGSRLNPINLNPRVPGKVIVKGKIRVVMSGGIEIDLASTVLRFTIVAGGE